MECIVRYGKRSFPSNENANVQQNPAAQQNDAVYETAIKKRRGEAGDECSSV